MAAELCYELGQGSSRLGVMGQYDAAIVVILLGRSTLQFVVFCNKKPISEWQ